MDLCNELQKSEELSLRFDRVCRTCISKWESLHSEKDRFQSIYEFTEDNKDMRILELLSTTVPQLLIQETDELPKMICIRCIDNLVELYRFQQMCVSSEYQLRSLLDSDSVAKFMPRIGSTTTPSSTAFEPLTEDPLQGSEVVEVNNFLQLEMNGEVQKPYEAIQFDKRTRSPRKKKITLEQNNADSTKRLYRKSKIGKGKNNLTTQSKETKIDAHDDGRMNNDNLRCPQDQTYDMEVCTESKEISNVLTSLEGYICSECPRRYSTLKSLTLHKVVHSSVICDKSTKSKKTLLQQEEYTCKLCVQKFKTRRLLLKHKPCHQKVKQAISVDKPYVCEFCHKGFQQSCTLKDHIRTHTGEQPFLCSECGKAFNSSSNMKQHLLRHSGEKRYECPDCPKKFPCLSDLASHKSVHRKIKPHVCDVCGAAFGKPYLLKKHKMYHNGEKPHKCEYCEMRFVCLDHMRRHMRTHTGEKPYTCKYCERAFAQSNDLIKHLRSHLGENVYKCELCPKAFRLATELRVHFTVHKNDDEETRAHNLKALMDDETKLRINITQAR